MRQFKLIKTYPGYPTLGVTAHECRNVIKYEIKNLVGTTISFEYTGHIENCSEYWEEITNKEEYEILTYYCASLNHILKANQFKDSQFGGNSEWKIHSVKRLFDEEVFTINDEICLDNGNYYGFFIKEFQFVINGSSGHLEKHRNKKFLKVGIASDLHSKPTFFYLENIVKNRKLLFVTEDGVNVFRGSTVFYVRKHDFLFQKIIIRNDASYNEMWWCFSTKEKAEEHILMNKPCLSVTDVMTAGYGICNPNSLISIVNSKINEQTKN